MLSKLSSFPRAHMFVANATSSIKGKSVEYWMEEFTDAIITDKCSCGQCYSFTLKTSKKHFTDNSSCVGNFGDVLVVLRDNGEYLEVEIPQNIVVPFADDFNVFHMEMSPINETKEQAYLVVQEWFNQNTQNELSSVIVD